MSTVSYNGLVAVQGVRDILRMRKIRNNCREFMTGNTQPIGLFEQLRWYKKVFLPSREWGAMLGFLLWDQGRAIGYGLITRRKGEYWVSGGLLKSERGRGQGELLFDQLTRVVHIWLQATAYLDVLQTNTGAIALYEKIGYQATDRDDRVIVMRFEA